jgi:PadR family transcriptional regulator PadR
MQSQDLPRGHTHSPLLLTARRKSRILLLTARGKSNSGQDARSIAEELMKKTPENMLQGTLDMLILKVLAVEPMHGWGITKRIQQVSEGTLEVNQGSLYSCLLRATRAGWIKSEWRTTENNRRARYYSLTRAGEKRLRQEEEKWARMVEAVGQVLALS